MKRFIISNVSAVLHDRVIDNARIVIEDGIVVDLGVGNGTSDETFDGRGAFCIPGIVDTHSDGLEMEHRPRPGAKLPLDFSLRSFEARVRASGITTLFHGIGFENDGNRTVDLANDLVDLVHGYLAVPTLVDHRVLYRIDARDADGFTGVADRLDRDRLVDPTPLVSFEDHTPGQGQYKDRAYFERWIMGTRNIDAATARAEVDQLVAERDSLLHHRAAAIPWLTERAARGEIRLMSHDPATIDDIDEALGWNASIAEFPTTVAAAKHAKLCGMRTVCGAPNVIRGGSHSGNVSAAELVSLGLCDGLSSDYLPFSMVGSVGALVRLGACSLPEAVRMVTSGPARTVGLDDRGTLKIGARADLVICHLLARDPTVIGTFRAGSIASPSMALQDV
ncbi:MAG: alpha-D-ribose 1-methylphosphonate 5-triphosphate diphosphatase [Actinobacteria bacterium]|nr:alpha-D-ribose 1-methylphosphonate 5-triphosphate diphosphatase [Actinomycetota bacterium]NBP53661.1 alpha-D-ribose 1-methylphosphonate 5-triphosphate diphosphatase [Actinomycetota bacterium]